MRKLLLIALVFVFFTLQAQATDVNTVKASIVKHSIEMGVDPAIALSIAKVESGYRHDAKSVNGAVGVFQLMPSTARRMGLNAYSLNDNIRGGIMYYKSMYNMFGSVELALAAYNAGPGNVKKFKNNVPPYAETKRFVASIMKNYNQIKALESVNSQVSNSNNDKKPTQSADVASAPVVTRSNKEQSGELQKQNTFEKSVKESISI